MAGHVLSANMQKQFVWKKHRFPSDCHYRQRAVPMPVGLYRGSDGQNWAQQHRLFLSSHTTTNFTRNAVLGRRVTPEPSKGKVNTYCTYGSPLHSHLGSTWVQGSASVPLARRGTLYSVNIDPSFNHSTCSGSLNIDIAGQTYKDKQPIIFIFTPAED